MMTEQTTGADRFFAVTGIDDQVRSTWDAALRAASGPNGSSLAVVGRDASWTVEVLAGLAELPVTYFPAQLVRDRLGWFATQVTVRGAKATVATSLARWLRSTAGSTGTRVLVLDRVDLVEPDSLQGLRGFLDEAPDSGPTMRTDELTHPGLLVVLTMGSFGAPARTALDGRISSVIELPGG
mgnify:FL=1|jgi:hypothetical protein